jgi:hypothetical protein
MLRRVVAGCDGKQQRATRNAQRATRNAATIVHAFNNVLGTAGIRLNGAQSTWNEKVSLNVFLVSI